MADEVRCRDWALARPVNVPAVVSGQSRSGSAGGALRIAAVVLGAIVTLACGPKPLTTTPSEIGQPVIRRIVVLGDSLAVSPSPAESFPARLQLRITNEGLPFKVTNAGVNGETTQGGLRRFEPLLASDVAVVIVELGANDGLQGVSVETVERNLSTIISAVLRSGRLALLCGIEVPPLHGFAYSLSFHWIFPRLAEQHSIPLVPFLLAGVILNPDLNGPDFIHPNAAGAERMAETVWPYLRPLLERPVTAP